MVLSINYEDGGLVFNTCSLYQDFQMMFVDLEKAYGNGRAKGYLVGHGYHRRIAIYIKNINDMNDPY